MYLIGLCHLLYLACQKKMPGRSPHAQLGDVKQFREDFHLSAEESAADKVLIQKHAEEACNSIDLGRMSKENMPNEIMVNILTHLTEPVMPHYQNLDGKAASYLERMALSLSVGFGFGTFSWKRLDEYPPALMLSPP